MTGRRENRLPFKLPVWVWGTEPNGKLFVEQAVTVNITPNGGNIKGLKANVVVGSVLSVQNEINRARFEVTWIGEPGTATEDQIGIKLVEPGRQERKPVLYIDYREDELSAFKSVLEAHGYAPVLAANSDAGVQFTKTMAPSAIILYWPMHDSEPETILRIKSVKPNLPVILLTDHIEDVPSEVLFASDSVILRGEPTRKLMSELDKVAGAGLKPKWPLTRTAPRYAVNMDVRLSVLRCGERTEFHGRATDISEGGVNVVMHADLQLGEIVTVWLPLPFARTATRIDGCVRRHDAVGYGVEFVNLENSRREEIRSLCKILPPLEVTQESAQKRAASATV